MNYKEMHWENKIKKIIDEDVERSIILHNNVNDINLKGLSTKAAFIRCVKYVLNEAIDIIDLDCSKIELIDVLKKQMNHKPSDENNEKPKIYYLREIEDYFSMQNNEKIIDIKNIILQFISSREFFVSKDYFVIEVKSFLKLPEEVIDETYLVNRPYPDFNERGYFINQVYESAMSYQSSDQRLSEKLNPVRLRILSNLTGGLTLKEIEKIMLKIVRRDHLDINAIKQKKRQIIRNKSGGAVQLLDNDDLSLKDYKGKEKIIANLKETLIQPLLTGKKKELIQNYLIPGPPGVGKTYLVECIAGEANVPVVLFNIDQLKSKWVGETESKLQIAFSTFKALAPIIVVLDEIDQMLDRGQDHSNSVDKNVMKMFLKEMERASKEKDVIYMAACNYPNEVDSALKRSGRFNKKIPFLRPNEKERFEVFLYHVNKFRGIDSLITEEALSKKCNEKFGRTFGEKTEGFTHAELAIVAEKARELQLRDEEADQIEYTHLLRALDYIIPNDSKSYEEMEELALKEANDKELIPESYLTRMEKDIIEQS